MAQTPPAWTFHAEDEAIYLATIGVEGVYLARDMPPVAYEIVRTLPSADPQSSAMRREVERLTHKYNGGRVRLECIGRLRLTRADAERFSAAIGTSTTRQEAPGRFLLPPAAGGDARAAAAYQLVQARDMMVECLRRGAHQMGFKWSAVEKWATLEALYAYGFLRMGPLGDGYRQLIVHSGRIANETMQTTVCRWLSPQMY